MGYVFFGSPGKMIFWKNRSCAGGTELGGVEVRFWGPAARDFSGGVEKIAEKMPRWWFHFFSKMIQFD